MPWRRIRLGEKEMAGPGREGDQGELGMKKAG